VFALITAGIRSHGGDVSAGVVDAMRWLAENVPIYAVNVLLSTATDMWALRYPETHELYLSDRRETSPDGQFQLRTKRIRAHSQQLRLQPSVVFATERMDDDARWQLLDPGELVHVDARLQITRDLVLPNPPRHRLHLEELSPTAQTAQHATV
jgi:glutamine amidotransferase